MSDKVIQEFNKNQLKEDIPELRPGQTIKVHQKIKEGDKERVQVFEGIVVGIRGGKGMDGTFTVRKVSEGIGVEKIFPIHLPSVEKIEIIKTAKARQAKLYYLRDKEIKMKEAKEKHEKHLKKEEELAERRRQEQEAAAKKDAEEKAAKEAAEKAKQEAEQKAEADKKVEEKSTKNKDEKPEEE